MFVTIVRNLTMYTDVKETAITKIAVWLIFIPILNRLTLCTIRGLVVYETLNISELMSGKNSIKDSMDVFIWEIKIQM